MAKNSLDDVVNAKVAAIWNENDRICFAINKGKRDGVKRRDTLGFGFQEITDPETGEKLADYAPYTAWVAEARDTLAVCLVERLKASQVANLDDIGLAVGTPVRSLLKSDVTQTDGDPYL